MNVVIQTIVSIVSKHRVLALHYFCFWEKIVLNVQIRISGIMYSLTHRSLLKPSGSEIYVIEIRLV